MNSRYNYDENAQTWPVFVLSVLSVGLVPLTVQLVANVRRAGAQAGKATQAEAQAGPQAGPQAHQELAREVQQYRRAHRAASVWTSALLWAVVAGWAAVAALVYCIATGQLGASGSAAGDAAAGFDPYALLGIDLGATEKEIKSHYKKLSVKFHPDKLQNVADEDRAGLEERFVLITKAYKALTDEITRENYLKYGHPDGPQEVLHGIALPKFLIEGKTSPVLLVLYIVVISAVLPYLVSSWWARTKSYTKKGLRVETASNLASKIVNFKPSSIVTVDMLLDWLSEAREYSLLYPGISPAQVKAELRRYLARDLSDKNLQLASVTPLLLSNLISFGSAFRNSDIVATAIDTLKHLTQACDESQYNELLQLPNVHRDTVLRQPVKKLGKLLKLSDAEIGAALGIQSPDLLARTIAYAKRIPILHLLKAEFKVAGESVVTPQSTAYISIKVAVKSGVHQGKKLQINPGKLKEAEDFEHLQNPFKVVNDQPPLPDVLSAYFPVARTSAYVATIALQKDGKVCENPTFFKNLDLSNLHLTNEEFINEEKVKVGTLKIPLTQPTPAQPGSYEFRVMVKSVDYFVQDLDFPLVMKVENPPKIEEVDYDIPEDEDDSGDEDEDDSEDDSEESDFTDINTDTEDEED